ncbi:hypothetical protein PPACK8108_LOCUS1282 [Phakopsora pachyrhizi]|uniref:Uncharacterized protein n=1 Tax=Phakopsora pachyrhizi TaxID=170000 RepID=A0AAV0AGR6_PHAPC|nr:hypothetical protein PPACK8108_LOCUS1282 [Phakopsora pachyrhizi]
MARGEDWREEYLQVRCLLGCPLGWPTIEQEGGETQDTCVLWWLEEILAQQCCYWLLREETVEIEHLLIRRFDRKEMERYLNIDWLGLLLNDVQAQSPIVRVLGDLSCAAKFLLDSIGFGDRDHEDFCFNSTAPGDTSVKVWCEGPAVGFGLRGERLKRAGNLECLEKP